MNKPEITLGFTVRNLFSDDASRFAERALTVAAGNVSQMIGESEYMDSRLECPKAETELLQRTPLQTMKEFPVLVVGFALLAGLKETKLFADGNAPSDDSIDEKKLLDSVADEVSGVYAAAIRCFHVYMVPSTESFEEHERRIDSDESISPFTEEESLEFARENPELFAAYYRGFVDLYKKERTLMPGGQ